MRLEIELTEDQRAELAVQMVVEMKRQGMVMVEPERTRPYSVIEAADALGVSEPTVRNWVEAEQLVRVQGTGRVLLTAESVHAKQRGRV